MSDHRSQGQRFEDAMKGDGKIPDSVLAKVPMLVDVTMHLAAVVDFFLFCESEAGKRLPELVLPATGATKDGEALDLEIIVRRNGK